MTAYIDILTGLIILPIPTALLWRVKNNLRRKTVIGTVLSRSISMIAIAIIRVALTHLGNNVTDSVWILLWHYHGSCSGSLLILLDCRPLAFWSNEERGNLEEVAAVTACTPIWRL